MVDSHLALPVIAEDIDQLDATDFVPFKALASIPWGMTAHALVRSVDPDRPATLSAPVIKDVIRQRIGFKGILITDDLSMNALTGEVSDRVMQALAAGCDLALHCNGDMAEMESAAKVARPMSSRLLSDIKAAERLRLERARPDIDPEWARDRVREILGSS
jgi:beta-N-acetylhexosaminidase